MATLGNYRMPGLIYNDLAGLNICQSLGPSFSNDSAAIKCIFNGPSCVR